VKVTVITDNTQMYHYINEMLVHRKIDAKYYCTVKQSMLPLPTIDMKHYQPAEGELIINAHGKQIFPAHVVSIARCINIHPGLNPYNRGYYSQVFSILNGYACGATIHVMNEDIDSGPIIAQEKITIEPWDTSATAYDRIFSAEVRLLYKNIDSILNNTYTTYQPYYKGNLNTLADFKKLCKIDLNESLTFKDAIDRLRALTHLHHLNAYFVDDRTGEKVYLKLSLVRDSEGGAKKAT
jgi:methionyl-tRNA formyltransferase